MRYTKIYFIICFLGSYLSLVSVKAQFNQVTLFPGISSFDLIDSLKQVFKPQIVLDYNTARDTLFARIYQMNDSVRCVYTGRTLYLDPAADPSTYLYSGGSGLGINTEHTFPQSKGAAEGNARSDMHHLFPVRSAANSARNNFPYAQIPDDQVNTWYYDVYAEPEPSFEPDLYSELNVLEAEFEPREDHKGNAARAMFYFYTMYKAEADQADPVFFASQLPTLCNWHLMDPVDSLEWQRSNMIAQYQQQRANPFVLDCSLVQRTYCPTNSANSCITSLITEQTSDEDWQIYPNPIHHHLKLDVMLKKESKAVLRIFDQLGICLYSTTSSLLSTGYNVIEINDLQLQNGLYLLQLELQTSEHRSILCKKLQVLKP